MRSMSASSLGKINGKKSKLKRRLETNHPNCFDKLVEFFESKLNSIQGQRNVMTKFTAKNKLAVYSSYVASTKMQSRKKLIQLMRIC